MHAKTQKGILKQVHKKPIWRSTEMLISEMEEFDEYVETQTLDEYYSSSLILRRNVVTSIPWQYSNK